MEKYQKARQILVKLNSAVKEMIPTDMTAVDFSKVGHSELGVGFLDGKAIERVIIILKGCGCEWAQKKEGGCTMCGHLSGSSKGKFIPPRFLKKQFDETMDRYNFFRYPMLCLYNGGSLLNEKEIDPHLRRYMFKKINSNRHIKRLIIESRSEYITSEKLDEIERLLPHITVEIGVGVETTSDIIRDLILNKGATTQEFIECVRKFRGRKTEMLAYILLNPPFLTESEAIADTIAAIEFAHKIGIRVVSLEAVSIQDLTLVSFLAEAGFYQTPWIWSIFEIIKKTYQLGLQIRIGGFEFFPIPKEFTSNCSACDEKMIAGIEEFNRTNDLGALENLSCSRNCDRKWRKNLEKTDHRDLPTRIIKTIEAIDVLAVMDRLNHNGGTANGNGMEVIQDPVGEANLFEVADLKEEKYEVHNKR
jgi:archaeosine synthase beta-subunit